jgi:DNA modification methylase
MEPSSSLPLRCTSVTHHSGRFNSSKHWRRADSKFAARSSGRRIPSRGGFGRYKFQHEPIFYCHVKGQSDEWYSDKSQSTLWAEKKPAADRLHPISKPVELIERALHDSSKTGALVVDLFGGSGSTLIACERRDRLAHLMELDPKYVDVIVTRWQDYTGKVARLDGD